VSPVATRRSRLLIWSGGAASGVVLAALVIWTGPRWLVAPIAKRAPGCLYSVHTRERAVALTLDDGPATETSELLRVLRENDARATFFLISTRVAGREATVNEILGQGHEIGNHMTRDEPSVRLSPEAFDAAVTEAGAVLGRFAPVHWLRPGSGWYTPRMVATVERAGYRCALGSIYPFDAQLPSSTFASSFILANVKPGAVIVLHDGAARGRRTAKTLQRVLPALRTRGYRVVSLSALARLGTDVATQNRHQAAP
jgi:peptidoglycan/xylan/chitin deacetylase (PgdA/CDA1 family)